MGRSFIAALVLLVTLVGGCALFVNYSMCERDVDLEQFEETTTVLAEANAELKSLREQLEAAKLKLRMSRTGTQLVTRKGDHAAAKTGSPGKDQSKKAPSQGHARPTFAACHQRYEHSLRALYSKSLERGFQCVDSNRSDLRRALAARKPLRLRGAVGDVLTLSLQMRDSRGRVFLDGGDELTVALRHKGTGVLALAEIWRDMLNGTYVAAVHCPYAGHFEVLVQHRLQCYQGMARGAYARNDLKVANATRYHSMGSLMVAAGGAANSRAQLPLCSELKGPVLHLDHGYWRGASGRPGDVKSLAFHPMCCRLSEQANSKIGKYVIGDSTMPSRTIEVGDVYHIRRYINRWKSYREAELPMATTGEVLVMNIGLHFLRGVDDPRQVSRSVQRMLCEVAEVYVGKMALIGTTAVMDGIGGADGLTDLRGRFFDQAMLGLLEKSHFKVSELCAGVNTTKIDGVSKPLGTDRRTIFYASLRKMLESKGHLYRNNDKIHPGGALFFGQHRRLIWEVLNVRDEAD